MKTFAKGICFASFCSLVLGFISATVVSLVGPCMQILVNQDQSKVYEISSLVGPSVGRWLSVLTGESTVTALLLLNFLPFLLLTVAGVKAVFYFLQVYSWERIGELVSKQMRTQLMSAYLSIDPNIRTSALAVKKESELSSVLSNDIKLMREYLVHFYGGFPREILQVSFMIATLLFLSPKLFCIFFVGVMPAVAITSRLGKKLRRRAARALADYSVLTEWLQQRLIGVETIKHYRTEALEVDKFHKLTDALYLKFYRAAKVKARTSPMVEIVAILSLVVVLFIALSDIEKGALSGSIAMSFFASLALLCQSATALGRYFNSNREGAAAVDRIKEFYLFVKSYHKKDIVAPVAQARESDDIVLKCKDLGVRYPGAKKFALKGFTFSFHKGLIYGISGPSGSGKSTLFSVLLGLQEASEGSFSFFSKSTEEGFKVGYMPQSIRLMRGSLWENIVYPAVERDEGRLKKACDLAGLSHSLAALPDGLDTQVGLSKDPLSGGQVQRVLLARIFYHDYDLILVDEGTSALDPLLEQQIYSGLRALADKGVSILMIAHRKTALDIVDECIYLEPVEDVLADGSH